MMAKIQKLRGTGPIRVFYFPYAGGSATSFHYIDNHLGPGFQSYGVDPPGHGSHGGEFLEDFDSFFQACADAVMPYLIRPYVLVGYSLGGLVVHELIQLLQEKGGPMPDSALLGGCLPPRLVANSFVKKGWHQMADEEILEELFREYDMPPELRENPGYLSMLLPLYRADSRVFYSYAPKRLEPIRTRLRVFGGREDKDIPPADLVKWAGTGFDVKVDILPGSHMFLRDNGRIMAEAIKEKSDRGRAFAPQGGFRYAE